VTPQCHRQQCIPILQFRNLLFLRYIHCKFCLILHISLEDIKEKVSGCFFKYSKTQWFSEHSVIIKKCSNVIYECITIHDFLNLFFYLTVMTESYFVFDNMLTGVQVYWKWRWSISNLHSGFDIDFRSQYRVPVSLWNYSSTWADEELVNSLRVLHSFTRTWHCDVIATTTSIHSDMSICKCM